MTELDDARWFTREEVAAALAGDARRRFPAAAALSRSRARCSSIGWPLEVGEMRRLKGQRHFHIATSARPNGDSWKTGTIPLLAGCCLPGSSRWARRSSPAKCSMTSAPRRWAIRSRASRSKAKAPKPNKPIAVYLAAADPAKGEQVFKKCAACHNADPGGANALGPALYGVHGQAPSRRIPASLIPTR